jgi:hypothetical protein
VIPSRTRAGKASLFAAFVALLFQVVAEPARAKSVPPGLPRHFGFGIEAGPGDSWMPDSGISWDYHWQYLAGGVNTKQGWETRNPNGSLH